MSQLASGFKDDDSTSLFSPYFKDIVGALLDAVWSSLPCLCVGSSCCQHTFHCIWLHVSAVAPPVLCAGSVRTM